MIRVVTQPNPKVVTTIVQDVSNNKHVIKRNYELFDLSLQNVPYTAQLVVTYSKNMTIKGMNVMLFDYSGNMVYNINTMTMINSLPEIFSSMKDMSCNDMITKPSKPLQYLIKTGEKSLETGDKCCYGGYPYYGCHYDSDSDGSIDSWHDYMMNRNHYYYSRRY